MLFTRLAEAKQTPCPITAAHGGAGGPVPGRHVRDGRQGLGRAVKKRSTRWRCDLHLHKFTLRDVTPVSPRSGLKQAQVNTNGRLFYYF